MDNYKEPKGDRRKKSDKSKEKYERNGVITQKHIRIVEALTEKRRTVK